MLPMIRTFLAQPYMLSPAFETLLHEMKSPYKLFDAPCPLKMAEKQLAGMQAESKKRKCVAVLPLFGMIDQHGGWMTEMLGGTSLDSWNSAFDMLMSEDRVSDILVNAHTPGGTVYGVKETSDRIFAARGTKRVVCVANSMLASAGYYIGSACERVYATDGADVGSVGVYQMHFDQSKAMEAEGISVTIEREPAFKAEGNPFEPLSDEARAEMKSDVHRIYQQFTSDVARYRGMDAGTVRETFGKGRCLDSSAAVKCGMVDRVASFDDVLSRMQDGRMRSKGATSANDDWDAPVEDASGWLQRMAMAGLAVQ